MSFILDALKKSELERQRQASPGLVETGVARPRARLPVWAIALSVLLAINLLVLLVVLTRSWWWTSAAGSGGAGTAAHAQPASRRDAPPGTTDGAAPSGDAHFSPLDPSAEYAPEVPVAPATPAASAPTPATGAAVHSPITPGAPGTRAARRRDPVLSNGDYQPAEEETLPSMNEMNLTGAQTLPELHLDVHVFATNSAERFVFINMRKYHEGATLQEGPTVERIRRDGVILNYQGLRFLLPRQ